MKKKGIIQVYTGNGKGKTTAAIGNAIRALGHGWKIIMIQFAKGSEKYGEIQACKKFLEPNFIIKQYGLDSFIDKNNPSDEDIKLANLGFEFMKEVLKSSEYDLVILDELNIALDFNLLDCDKVLEVLTNRNPEIDIIITGRYAPTKLIEIADLVSEVKLIKHHYDQGIAARTGIEF